MGKYIGIVGSFASIIALFFISTDNGYIRMAVFVAGIIFSVIALGFEIKAFFKTRPLKFDKQGNTDYMNQILKKEGEYIVFAGELSWVNNDEILNTMKSKGEKLSLCANNTASHLEELKMAGVNVYAFDDFSPRTHFTVIEPVQQMKK